MPGPVRRRCVGRAGCCGAHAGTSVSSGPRRRSGRTRAPARGHVEDLPGLAASATCGVGGDPPRSSRWRKSVVVLRAHPLHGGVRGAMSRFACAHLRGKVTVTTHLAGVEPLGVPLHLIGTPRKVAQARLHLARRRSPPTVVASTVARAFLTRCNRLPARTGPSKRCGTFSTVQRAAGDLLGKGAPRAMIDIARTALSISICNWPIGAAGPTGGGTQASSSARGRSPSPSAGGGDHRPRGRRST